MTDADLKRIAARLRLGPTTKGVTLSPWARQLQADAQKLLDEVKRLRKWTARHIDQREDLP